MPSLVISGTIKQGRKLSRGLGFPTINISVPRTVKRSQWGIYFSLVTINGKVHPGATYLGPPKTFALRRVVCETHLLTSQRNLYGHKVKKVLLFKFRPIKKFSTVQALKKQIEKDIKAARRFFGL